MWGVLAAFKGSVCVCVCFCFLTPLLLTILNPAGEERRWWRWRWRREGRRGSVFDPRSVWFVHDTHKCTFVSLWWSV